MKPTNSASTSRPSPGRTPRRLRRRIKAPPAGGGSGGCRRRGPHTPLLKWDFGDGEEEQKRREEEGSREGVSVRRLAAAVWRLRPPEKAAVNAGAGLVQRGGAHVGLEHVPRHLQVQLLKHNTSGYYHYSKNEVSSPISVLEPKSGELHKLQLDAASAMLPLPAMEKATKWEPESLTGLESDDAYLIARQLNLLDEQQDAAYVSNLELKLQQARNRISELEAERRSAKKKLDHFFKKLAEEKAAWRSREHEKVRAIIDDMKAEIDREKKTRRRLEVINSKLLADLKEAKISVKELLHEFEKERKARELVEEVCNELAREVDEDKVEIDTLKQESMKFREEVEEERKMLQMAEVWREERVQMKLIDAKLTLEAKYSELNKFQQDVEAFLEGHKCARGDIAMLRESENILKAIESVKSQESVEFTYEPPPPSEDIFSIFEELRPSEETEIKDIEPYYNNSHVIYEPEIQEVSPATDIFLEKPAKVYSNRSMRNDSETDDASSWETTSHGEMHRSSDSPDGSEASVNKICERSMTWASGNDLVEGGDSFKLNDDFGETYFASMKQQKKKESAISKLWKSSRPKNAEVYKREPVDVINGRQSDVRLSNGTYSTEGGTQEIGLSPPSIGQWSSPDSINIHLSRGFRGCIECPRGIQKHSLKAKLLEARMESQKIQLRHVLKQKI